MDQTARDTSTNAAEPSSSGHSSARSSAFAERRARACAAMGEGVLVLFSTPEFIRNNDVTHPYRQDSDFFYLTGLDEPESVMVLSAGEHPQLTLFVRPRNKEREIWDGPRTGVEGAVAAHGANNAYPIEELGKRLPELLKGHEKLYYRFGVYPECDQRLIGALVRSRALARRKGRSPTHLIDSAAIVHEQRRIKSGGEIASLRQAIEITRQAHLAAMLKARPGCFEYELEAELLAVFRRSGSERAAYSSIVGSGPNATILHHIRNDRQAQAGDLVLIDAGCEFDYYAADITRVFPVSGKFTAEQRQIYQIVLDAQQAAFDAIAPGASQDDAHAAALRHITEQLIEIGFIQGPLELALSEERYKPYFMHRTGHYLGMDVHDVGLDQTMGKPRPLEPGVVITIEPGIYIAVDNEQVPAAYRGIGVRIEDDILVTETGYENLSQSIPKGLDEIEALMAGAAQSSAR
ncbi:MAG TPA: aminopeptidase P N-terminal domain-containing protein [Polyangiaceae bacterium]|jgi:Xaa-Pro aminopeptidase|nr:aminopeptidase P N-terminal domain-containing protein [Polyangiaceae bacterium]